MPWEPDSALAAACAAGEPAALAAFERDHLPQVAGYVARLSREKAFVDEVQQLLREKLFVGKKITEYAGQGPLGAWLRVVSVRIAIDVLRARGKAPAPIDVDGIAEPLCDSPELELVKSRYLPEVKAAFTEALAALGSEERNLLRLHLVDGLNLEEMARLFQVNRSTVFRWMAAAKGRVLDDARDRLQARLGVSAEEMESLLRVVRSRLDLSLSEVLR
jgi:RNA polymerase sigma-70 factor (ECF subfamily)